MLKGLIQRRRKYYCVVITHGMRDIRPNKYGFLIVKSADFTEMGIDVWTNRYWQILQKLVHNF